MINPITFPGLGLGPFDPNPAAFHLPGGHPIMWYGIIIAAGFLLAAAYGVLRAPAVGLRGDDVADALLWGMPAGIIGARVYYVVFNWGIFAENPLSVLYVWEGGLAIYGGVIFAGLAAWLFARRRKISVLSLLDLTAAGFFIGQCIGRWGNFVNREVFGLPTDLPWRMELYDTETWQKISVHPTFLYESLWTLAGFLILNWLLRRRQYPGQCALVYVAWYGLGRGLIEGIRADTLFLFGTGIKVSQALAFLTFALATATLVFFEIRRRKPALVTPSEPETPPETATPEKKPAPKTQPEFEKLDQKNLNYRLKGKDEE